MAKHSAVSLAFIALMTKGTFVLAETCATDNCAATSPNHVVTVEDKLNHIFFTNGGSTLDQDAVVQLEKLVSVLNSEPMQNTCLRLVGHADGMGPADVNMDISWDRATAVHGFISAQLNDPKGRIELAAQGENTPLTYLDAENPWQRRVEILAKSCLGS